MSTPDHVENTGDNLRHAADVQKQAQDDQSDTRLPRPTNRHHQWLRPTSTRSEGRAFRPVRRSSCGR